MDNCRFYQRQDLIRLLNKNFISYKFVSPYLSQLNSIKEFFSYLKAIYNNSRPRPVNQNETINSLKNNLNNNEISFDGFYWRIKLFLNFALANNLFYVIYLI